MTSFAQAPASAPAQAPQPAPAQAAPANPISASQNKMYTMLSSVVIAAAEKMPEESFAKLTVLSANTAHDYEHYGNMVTYMRLKGIVPPTSEKKAPQKISKFAPKNFPLLRRGRLRFRYPN